MPVKLVLFDLDGTLLDTLDDLAEATNAALVSFGMPPVPSEAYRLMVGNGALVLMHRAFAKACQLAGPTAQAAHPPMPSDADLVAAFNREYASRWDCKTHPYEGIRALLERLRAAGLKLAILSNKPDVFTCKVAARYFPDGEFGWVTGMRPDRPGKPDPALAFELCQKTGVRPEDTALVGDSGSDMVTAVVGGMHPVGVLWGFRPASELLSAGAVHLAATPAELGDILLALR